MPAYNAQQAAFLAEMAALAQDVDSIGALPGDWVVLQTFITTSQMDPTVQGFYAKGTLPGGSGTSAVLALGVPWQSFLNNYASGTPSMSPPPSWLNAGAGNVDNLLSDTYSSARSQVWGGLAQAAGLPLYVTGMGLAGPVAQMAAADLRPGQTGPGTGQHAPSTAPACYVFSTAAEGDAGYAAWLATAVPQMWTVGLGTPLLPVDQFPSAPGTANGYAPAGTAVPVAALLPAWDDPWQERGIGGYLNALGGTYTPPPVAAGALPNPPAGLAQAQAYTMARLCAVAYQRAQHPGAITSTTGSFLVLGDVTANGVPFCTLFAGPDAVVAAFRGTVTWAEFVGLQALPAMIADYLGNATVQGGAVQVATSPVTSGSATTFRESLAAQVQAVIGSRPLILAGHDFGGGMANVTATDLAASWPALKPAAVYTFGAMPTGTFAFSQQFNAAFPSTSYQILRPGDFVGGVNVGEQYQPVNTIVPLTGTPPNDDPTQHPLAGYIALLDPWAVA